MKCNHIIEKCNMKGKFQSERARPMHLAHRKENNSVFFSNTRLAYIIFHQGLYASPYTVPHTGGKFAAAVDKELKDLGHHTVLTQ